MGKQSKERNPFWDSLKFQLIFIVVYGHMIETCVDDNPFNQAMYNFIYLFHMPLFVFISGHFSHIKDKRKYLIGMIYILETYFVFQFARCIRPVFNGGSFSLFPDIFIPKGILWYLACIVLWRMIILVANESWLTHNKWMILLSFIGMGLGIGFIKIPDGTSIRFFTLGFFFFLGYYLEDSTIKAAFTKVKTWIAFISILFLFVFVYFMINKDIRSVIYFGSYYDNIPAPPILYFMARIFLYSFATLIGFLFMRLIFCKPVFAKYGKYTLSIFMYHIFIVTALRPLFSNNIFPCHEILLFCYAIILCISLTWLTQHFKLMTIMLNPITYIISKYKFYKK
jgi:fucose 4-O-acetylase-like acetyltransferase